jgi:DNA-binding MarR family transcriptional regulator
MKRATGAVAERTNVYTSEDLDADFDSDESLFESFFTLQMLMREYRFHMHLQGGPVGDTSRGQGRILALLKLKDGMRARELAKLMGIRVSSLNETLGKMERNGYIVREPYAKDKRVILISLTEKGKSAKQPTADIPPLFDDFTEEEKELLGDFLDRMISNLEEQSGSRAKTVFERERKRREALFERMRNAPDEKRERLRRALFPAL